MNSSRALLIGGGGHGRVLLDTLLSKGITLDGILDPNLATGSSVLGVKVLGDDKLLNAFSPGSVKLVNGVGTGRRDLNRRIGIYDKFAGQGYEFISVVHDSCIIGRNVRLDAGVQLMAGAIIQCGTSIGKNSVLNTAARVDHDCIIGDHVFISPGVTLCGSVSVGRGSFLGAGSVICPGIKIGRGVVVGAGSVIISDIDDEAFCVGVPARSKGRKDHD